MSNAQMTETNTAEEAFMPAFTGPAPRVDFAILHGSLSPAGCVIRLNGLDEDHREGTARVFATTKGAVDAIWASEIRMGHIIVLRSGVGLDAVISALNANGLSQAVVIAEDRFDGDCFGPVVSGLGATGPVAGLQDDDVIRIDIAGRRIDVLNDMAGRASAHVRPQKTFGPLAKYAAMVSCAL
jgi:dihydroxy-acid dehydratase